jgi:hypothetical protein
MQSGGLSKFAGVQGYEPGKNYHYKLKPDYVRQCQIKRPATAYQLWAKDERAVLKSEGKSAGQIRVQLKSEWAAEKANPSDANQKYYDYASEVKSQYLSNVESLKQQGRDPNCKVVKRTPRALSGYNVFVKESYPNLKSTNPDAQASEILKMVASDWKGMSQDEKADYNDRARALHTK